MGVSQTDPMKTPEGFTPIKDLPFQLGTGRPQFRDSAFNLQMFSKQDEKKMWGVIQFKDNFMGPPGHTHGGAQAYILDEAMGTLCWDCGFPVVAKSIQIEFKKSAPLHEDLVVTAEIEKKEIDHLVVTSTLMTESGRVFATGSGVFHLLSYAQFSQLFSDRSYDMSRWFPELKKSSIP